MLEERDFTLHAKSLSRSPALTQDATAKKCECLRDALDVLRKNNCRTYSSIRPWSELSVLVQTKHAGHAGGPKAVQYEALTMLQSHEHTAV